MRILVTGGAGFIGSHIVEHFHHQAEVRVLDNLRSGYQKNIDKFNVYFINGSVMDPGILKQAMHGVDYVFHLAAMISVPESMHKPVECVNINTIGTLNVLEAAAHAGVKTLPELISSHLWRQSQRPKLESMFPEPKSPYAETKLSGGVLLRYLRKNVACPPPACAISMSSAPDRIPPVSMRQPSPFSFHGPSAPAHHHLRRW